MQAATSEGSERTRQGAGLLLALAIFAWHVVHSNFLIDDAYISFRYAANWASGGGLAFQPGEDPVEGFSNFLWVALLAPFARAGVPLETASRALSILAAVLTLIWVHRALARRGFSTRAITLGTLCLASCAPFATWATGGLETALFSLTLLAAFDGLSPQPGDGRGRELWIPACAGAALPLVRTDGIAFAVALCIATWLAAPRAARRRLRPFLTAALVSFGIYLAWRRVHYGSWVANTVRAKADPSAALYLRGLKTTASYLVTLGAPILAAGSLFPGRPASDPIRARRSFSLAAALMLAAFLAYNTLAGGDWMPMYRLLAPASPFLAIAIAGLLDRLPPLRAAACGLVACALIVLPSLDRSVAPRALRERLDFRSFRTGYQTERARWERGVENVAAFVEIGKGLAQIARPGDSMAAGAIGAIGYHSGLEIFDRNGLIDPDVAAREADAQGRSAGHDKRVPRAYFVPQRPTFFEARIVNGRVEGPDSPHFAKVVGHIGGVLDEPGEAPLRERCIAEVHPIVYAGDSPGPEKTLVVLRSTEDRAAARAFWARYGR